MVRPRYSVTTEADEPRNFSAISATAVTLSGRAIPCLLSVVVADVRRHGRSTATAPETENAPAQGARGGAAHEGASRTSSSCAGHPLSGAFVHPGAQTCGLRWN